MMLPIHTQIEEREKKKMPLEDIKKKFQWGTGSLPEDTSGTINHDDIVYMVAMI